jgi:transcriptional regulator with XRE-family HTH domain
MEPVCFGNDVRLLRRRRGWSQQRLADEAHVPRWVVSAAERGEADRLGFDRLAQIVRALGAYLSVRILFEGEALDRLRDQRHAAVVERMVARLLDVGWELATEVSFSVYGERGSIDILAWHPTTGALLVIEVKSVVPDVGGMLMTLDRKVRLAPDLARARGWEPTSVSRLLVLPEHRTSRRRIEEHAGTFRSAFPQRNREVGRWLSTPEGTVSGLLFLPPDQPANGGQVFRSNLRRTPAKSGSK